LKKFFIERQQSNIESHPSKAKLDTELKVGCLMLTDSARLLDWLA